MGVKRALKQLVPPLIWTSLSWLYGLIDGRKVSRNQLIYNGFIWPELADSCGWNDEKVIRTKCLAWEPVRNKIMSTGALGFSFENPGQLVHYDLLPHNLYMSYGYSLGYAIRQKDAVRILDWGGGLGHYYLLSRSLFPELSFDYHCRELKEFVKAGCSLLPEVHWWESDACLASQYDFVMISSSLQYVRCWKEQLRKILLAAKDYLYLPRTPIVDRGPSFVAIQEAYGTRMPFWVFNESEIFNILVATGFQLVREFASGEDFKVKNAPADVKAKSWLFRRQ